MKNLIFIISFLICSSAICQNKRSLLRSGNELYSDSSFNDAEISYRKSLAKDQDYFNASFNLADAIYKQERYEEASAIFNALKDKECSQDNLAKIYHNLGNSLFKEQKLDEAINAYKSGLRINPNDNETRHNLALCKKQKKEKENQEQNQENQEQNQENQEQNQENQEQNQENQEQKQENQEQKQENQEQKQENQEQKQENQEQKQENQEQKQEKEEVSKESAEKMLEAIQQKEKELQEELQKKKVKGKKINILKDW